MCNPRINIHCYYLYAQPQHLSNKLSEKYFEKYIRQLLLPVSPNLQPRVVKGLVSGFSFPALITQKGQ